MYIIYRYFHILAVMFRAIVTTASSLVQHLNFRDKNVPYLESSCLLMSFMLLKKCPFLARQTHTSVQRMSAARNWEKPEQSYPFGGEITFSSVMYSFVIITLQ